MRGIINGHKVNFVSVCAPNNPVTKKIFFSEELPKFLSVDYRNVVGGDFNCVDSLELDTLNHSNTSCTLVGHKELNAVIADFGLEDRWRVQNPGCKKYTWSNKS